jgi:hypothetical protein
MGREGFLLSFCPDGSYNENGSAAAFAVPAGHLNEDRP